MSSAGHQEAVFDNTAGGVRAAISCRAALIEWFSLILPTTAVGR